MCESVNRASCQARARPYIEIPEVINIKPILSVCFFTVASLLMVIALFDYQFIHLFADLTQSPLYRVKTS